MSLNHQTLKIFLSSEIASTAIVRPIKNYKEEVLALNTKIETWIIWTISAPSAKITKPKLTTAFKSIYMAWGLSRKDLRQILSHSIMSIWSREKHLEKKKPANCKSSIQGLKFSPKKFRNKNLGSVTRKRSNRRLDKSTKNSGKKPIILKETKPNLMIGDPNEDIDNSFAVIIN